MGRMEHGNKKDPDKKSSCISCLSLSGCLRGESTNKDTQDGQDRNEEKAEQGVILNILPILVHIARFHFMREKMKPC